MIEVWAVGPEIKEDDDEEKVFFFVVNVQCFTSLVLFVANQEARPSILDVDVEGTAMLRMMNRGPVSEGMRGNKADYNLIID